eukprot:CAMPEP_0171459936 /NCGR_PEP_ID=MMETSP0945-20130129/5008_1 /TAXON_ID=109269 /ORGANISM="Vaucheria litorea, Strain CCMP2940" /LENGTH=260 /DNA_ID=CAMNT_0011986029 /DNA_START=52 /DNA_END=834 /DNA_ORIENTATION=+
MATLESLKKKEKEAESDESKGQEYYAGGNSGDRGGSGLSVVGPPRDENRIHNPSDSIQNIISRASRTDPESQGDEICHTIYMYRNGFTIDDGPLRLLDDPLNSSFLNDLSRGVVPHELIPSARQGRHLNIKLEDRRTQDYVAPPYTAFGGEGHTASSSITEENIIVNPSDTENLNVPEVNESEPITTLQVRLYNGSKLRIRLNLTHTIRDIQALIRREGAGSMPYTLIGGYPPVPLKDFSKSIIESGLKGAQIKQKLCHT